MLWFVNCSFISWTNTELWVFVKKKKRKDKKRCLLAQQHRVKIALSFLLLQLESCVTGGDVLGNTVSQLHWMFILHEHINRSCAETRKELNKWALAQQDPKQFQCLTWAFKASELLRTFRGIRKKSENLLDCYSGGKVLEISRVKQLRFL